MLRQDPGVNGPSPLISIVVPAYIPSAREASLLDETLSTVDAQTWRNYEVLVVDDGSPYELDPLIRSHTRTTLVRQPNAGAAVARNTGIAGSRGENFIFLDADDHLLPGAIESSVQQLGSHPECGFVVGPHEEMTYEGDPIPWTIPPPPEGGEVYVTLLGFDWYIIPPSSAMFRRGAVEAVGGFRDPWGADDLDFYLRVARSFRAWCSQSPPVTRYRRYSASSSRDGERMLRSVREVYRRQWPAVAGDPAAELAFHKGLAQLTAIFTDCLAENIEDRLRARQWRRAVRSAAVLARENPGRLLGAMPRILKLGAAPSRARSRAGTSEQLDQAGTRAGG